MTEAISSVLSDNIEPDEGACTVAFPARQVAELIGRAMDGLSDLVLPTGIASRSR
jgi:hypothetical protein